MELQKPQYNGLQPRVHNGNAPVRVEYVDEGDIEGTGIDTAKLTRYWYAIKRRKWLVIGAALLGAAVGLLSAMPKVPLFQAATSIEIQAVNTNIMNLSPELTGTTTLVNDLPTQIAILSSKFMLRRVAEKVSEQSEGEYISKPHKFWVWMSHLGVHVGPSATSWRESVSTASRTVQVSIVPGTRIIAISCQSQNPKAAAAFVNTLAAEFINEHLEARWKSSQRTTEWLSVQMEDVRAKLQMSEQALQNYARSTGLMFTNGNTAVAERLTQLRNELFKAQAARMAQQSKYELLRSAPPGGILEVVDDPTLNSYQMKLSDLRQQLADLSVSFTPSHYSIRRLQAQITEIEEAYERVKTLLLKRLTNAYEVAGRDEKRLAAAYAEQERLVTEEEQKTIRYNLMKREVDTNRQMYDAMLAKMKEASIASTMLASNMRVIDHAEVPTYADVPSPVRNTTLGLFAGGLFASFILAGLYHFDRSVKLPGDIEAYLSIPELGVIPAADSDPSLPPLLGGTRRSLGLRLSGGQTKDEERLEMVTLHHEPSLMADCFRSIAASLLFTDDHGLGVRTVAVTSAFPLEGKSTVVSNLGLALAETRHRVLLIDADMRKPRLHSIYGIDNSNGLSKILQGNEDLDTLSLDRIIHPTRVAGLCVLPSGPAVRCPANFLYSLRMVELLRKCKAAFEWILFDTPPALQVVDARVISRLVDGVILVLRAGRTEHDLIRSVGKRLSADGTRVVGTILNDWKPEEVYANYYAEHLRHYHGS